MHERVIFLNVLDGHWKDHLLAMDQLKEGIGLRGYGQRDPLVEYKKESFTTFQDMMNTIDEEASAISTSCSQWKNRNAFRKWSANSASRK